MRLCKQCGKKIPDGKRSTAMFCSDGCKQQEYRERHGIAKPDFLSTSKPMDATNQQRNTLTEEQKHEQRILKMDIDNLLIHYEELMMERKELHAAIELYRRKKILPEKYLKYYANYPEYIPQEPSKPYPEHIPLEPSKPVILYTSREKYEADNRKLYTRTKDKYELKKTKSYFGIPKITSEVVGKEEILDEESYKEKMKKYDVQQEKYDNQLKEYQLIKAKITKQNSDKAKDYEIALKAWQKYSDAKGKDDGTILGIMLLNERYANIIPEIDSYKNQITEKKQTIRSFFGFDTNEDVSEDESDRRLKGADVLEMNFPTYNFSKEWKNLLGEPSKPFSMMVFGDAKAGKSYFCLSLAQYLTSFGSVAYFVVEEGIGETMRRKIETTGADDVFILPSQDINDIMSVLQNHKYKIVFIDSVSSAGMKVDDFKTLKSTFPKTSFIAILQTTKDNNYRGEKEWKHEVDAICELTKPEPRKSKIVCTGRFGGGQKLVEY